MKFAVILLALMALAIFFGCTAPVTDGNTFSFDKPFEIKWNKESFLDSPKYISDNNLIQLSVQSFSEVFGSDSPSNVAKVFKIETITYASPSASGQVKTIGFIDGSVNASQANGYKIELLSIQPEKGTAQIKVTQIQDWYALKLKQCQTEAFGEDINEASVRSFLETQGVQVLEYTVIQDTGVNCAACGCETGVTLRVKTNPSGNGPLIAMGWVKQ
ncbi:MAG: hypothetical protein WCI04_02330 [archaeon]